MILIKNINVHPCDTERYSVIQFIAFHLPLYIATCVHPLIHIYFNSSIHPYEYHPINQQSNIHAFIHQSILDNTIYWSITPFIYSYLLISPFILTPPHLSSNMCSSIILVCFHSSIHIHLYPLSIPPLPQNNIHPYPESIHNSIPTLINIHASTRPSAYQFINLFTSIYS